MAGRKAHHSFFAPTAAADGSYPAGADEFDESDVWSNDISGVGGRPIPASSRVVASAVSRGGVKKGGEPRSNAAVPAASSLPMSIPDWSKILGSSYGENKKAEWGGYFDDDDDREARARPIVPPHELLCRSRGASFSVQEGIGRTLKGRDLSRVRNAIWAKTGFQD